MRSVIFSLIKSVNVIRSLSSKNPFCAIVKGLRFFKPEKNNPYGDMRRNNKNGKLPRKRQFTPVLHRKRHTRRSFIRSFCVCPCGADNRGRTCTGLPMDPKSIASANSAISAFIYSFPLRLSYPRPTKIFRRARFVKIFIRVFL